MDLSQRLPRRYSQDPNDVFAMVRHHMSDDELAQPPLLVLPGNEKAAIHTFFQNAARHPGVLSEIDDERKKDLLELSSAFEKYPQYSRAVQYYKSLAGVVPRNRVAVHRLTFLEIGGVEQPGLVCRRLPERVPKPKPHPLHVRFHRNG